MRVSRLHLLLILLLAAASASGEAVQTDWFDGDGTPGPVLDWGKAFDRSAVCGPLHRVAEVGHLLRGFIRLSVNDEIRQNADLRDMIWDIPEQIAILSRSMTIEAGDLIYSGTPAGVGALLPGDVCRVEIEGLGALTTTIGARAGGA